MVDFRHKLAEVPLYGRLEHVVRTDYALRNEFFPWSEVVVDDCQHKAVLRSLFLQVRRAWGLTLNGKRFSVTLSGELGEMHEGRQVPWGGVTEITLIDTTGTGKFDLLQYGMVPESIPAWISAGKKP